MIDSAAILLSLSTLLGVTGSPPPVDNWNIEQSWKREGSSYTFIATSSTAATLCANNDSLVLALPQVIHGVHKIYADKALVFKSGDDTFKSASSFYETPTVPCELLKNASIVTWSISSYSSYFSRFRTYPEVRAAQPKDILYNVSFNLIAAGILLVLSLISFMLFYGKIRRDAALSVGVGSGVLVGYFLFTISPTVGIDVSMLTAHKIADTAIWFGIVLYVNYYRIIGYLGRFEFFFLCASSIVSIGLILTGTTGDDIQLGTSIPFLASVISLTSILLRSIRSNLQSPNTNNYLIGVANLVFFLSGTNDILHVTGVIDSFTFLPIGIASGVFITALFVNREIQKTYDQRDQLLRDLESLVAEKTQHLSSALQSLQSTQAELIQSARLASLGTLSAGIAHEINNSINFVNGALPPLEKIITKNLPESEAPKARRLLEAINHGTNLTVEIVRSLRNYTGLNQSKKKDVHLKEAVQSILTILKGRVRQTQIELDIPEDLTVFAHTVGLNQIFMNLISNALDAVPPDSGHILIRARPTDDSIEIRVQDNGPGIPDDIQKRIFDPFFTTKEVGKGTGLGLHIVQKEVERHHGDVQLESSLGRGTTFIIRLPAQGAMESSDDIKEAA